MIEDLPGKEGFRTLPGRVVVAAEGDVTRERDLPRLDVDDVESSTRRDFEGDFGGGGWQGLAGLRWVSAAPVMLAGRSGCAEDGGEFDGFEEG